MNAQRLLAIIQQLLVLLEEMLAEEAGGEAQGEEEPVTVETFGGQYRIR